MTFMNTVYRDIPRTDPELIATLRGVAVADLHDALPPDALPAALMHHSIRPITNGVRVCGPAVTVFGAPGDSLMVHIGLYLAHAGDVLVISNGGVPHAALWGGAVAFDARAAGIAGTIVDGPIRDTAAIRELGYPVWASSTTPMPGAKQGRGYVNLPLVCGGCLVNPGDIIVADDDGVLAIAPRHVHTLAAKAAAKSQAESAVRRRIEAGERLFETQNFAALLEEKGIVIRDGHCQRSDAGALNPQPAV